MVTGFKIQQIAVVFLVLALVTGCGAKNTRTEAPIQDLDIDPSFTWGEVEAHQIGVLAVTLWDEDLAWTAEILGSQLRDTLLNGPSITRSQGLGDRIAFHNPPWKVVPTAELADSVGWKYYTQLVDSYVADGDFSEEEVRTLELTLRDRLRYVVVTRVEDNQSAKWKESSSSGDETEHGAVRAMILDYKIYDLWHRNLVWSGWVQEKEFNTITISDHEQGSGLIGKVLQSAGASGNKVPETGVMLDACFDNLAQNLFPSIPFLCVGPPDNLLRGVGVGHAHLQWIRRPVGFSSPVGEGAEADGGGTGRRCQAAGREDWPSGAAPHLGQARCRPVRIWSVRTGMTRTTKGDRDVRISSDTRFVHDRGWTAVS